MGSLMPGWDSQVLDDHDTKVTRNQSLTKDEVEAFWRQHPGGAKPAVQDDTSGDKIDAADDAAAPAADDAAAAAAVESAPSNSRDWWTRSSWAFLNEPPLEEVPGKARRYTPQFHVARIATAGTGA